MVGAVACGGDSTRLRGTRNGMRKEADEAVRCLAATLKVIGHIENIGSIQLFLAVADKPGVTLSELHTALQMPRSTISRHVAQLMTGTGEKKGLVEYTPIAKDRRARAVCLTKEGERLVNKMVQVFNKRC